MQAHLKALLGKHVDNSTRPYAYVILQDLTPFVDAMAEQFYGV